MKSVARIMSVVAIAAFGLLMPADAARTTAQAKGLAPVQKREPAATKAAVQHSKKIVFGKAKAK